jgi:hypothetical protein
MLRLTSRKIRWTSTPSARSTTGPKSKASTGARCVDRRRESTRSGLFLLEYSLEAAINELGARGFAELGDAIDLR